MPKPTDPQTRVACLLRIALRSMKPAIYRDVLVDPATTLRKLHPIIQAAMGWQDEHLYAFAKPAKNKSFWRVPKSQVWEPASRDFFGASGHDDARCKVAEVLTHPKAKLLYMYDFGDDWEQVITFTSQVQTQAALAHLGKAQNGCPPENCGGPGAAEHWAAAWFDPQHPEHDEARDLFGDTEPGSVDFARLQRAVAKLQPKIRRRAGA